jgi:hypothetical protein
MNPPTPIQPYELLGVTYQTPLRDVRKRYYELAQLCHPDKGGTTGDMIALHEAYKWIEAQLQLAEDHAAAHADGPAVPPLAEVALLATYGRSRDDVRAWYDDRGPEALRRGTPYDRFQEAILHYAYQASMTDDPTPNFEALCDKMANTLIQEQDAVYCPASVPGGYGEDMDATTEDVKVEPFENKKDLVTYQEQKPHEAGGLRGASCHPVAAMDNYTTVLRPGFVATDYKEAFAKVEPAPDTDGPESSATLDELLEAAIVARSLQVAAAAPTQVKLSFV